MLLMFDEHQFDLGLQVGEEDSMTRRYVEMVEVRRRDEDPAEFIWRQRLYLVRAVLAHWIEARPWWLGPALSGDLEHGGELEHEIWRVEAAAGRACGSGVYDLQFDWSSGQWSLTGVVD